MNSDGSDGTLLKRCCKVGDRFKHDNFSSFLLEMGRDLKCAAPLHPCLSNLEVSEISEVSSKAWDLLDT